MKTIALEIRDRGTFIPMLAILMEASNGDQSYLLRRAGFGSGTNMVMLCAMEGGQANYDVYEWGDNRTRKTAHKYIEENFYKLEDGDVIDVEFILGETLQKKISERMGAY